MSGIPLAVMVARLENELRTAEMALRAINPKGVPEAVVAERAVADAQRLAVQMRESL